MTVAPLLYIAASFVALVALCIALMVELGKERARRRDAEAGEKLWAKRYVQAIESKPDAPGKPGWIETEIAGGYMRRGPSRSIFFPPKGTP